MVTRLAPVHIQPTNYSHLDTSVAPAAVVFGLFFLLPLGFSAYFVYNNTLLSVMFVGIGIPTLLFGISRWIIEGLTYKPLQDGLSSTVGLPIFIGSETCIFLALFATYWTLRLSADIWPPTGTPSTPSTTLAIVMTVLLVLSSVTIHIAEYKLANKDTNSFFVWLVYTIILGTAFLCCTAYEYDHLIRQSFVPRTNIFSTIFLLSLGSMLRMS